MMVDTMPHSVEEYDHGEIRKLDPGNTMNRSRVFLNKTKQIHSST